MSRYSLKADAQRCGVSTMVRVQGGRTAPLSPNALRLSIIESCYGPGMSFHTTTASLMDEMITRVVDTRLNKNGYLLGVAQHCIRNANNERAEYKRLCGLKKRRPNDEAALLTSSRQWLELARISQELHVIERGIS